MEDRIRILIARWNVDYALNLAVNEVWKFGIIRTITKDLWHGVRQEYERAQENATDTAKYRFQLFSFMIYQYGDETGTKSDLSSALEAYRKLVDNETWNDDDLEFLERFDYLLRQQAVKKAYLENGVVLAKKVFNLLWKSEAKAKYAKIKNSLRELLDGKVEVEVDDEESFNSEALNALNILASKLELPYLLKIAKDIAGKVECSRSEPSINDSFLPQEMNLKVSGVTLSKALKVNNHRKKGQPLYLGKKSFVKLRDKCNQLRKKKIQLIRGLTEHFPDFECNLKTDDEDDNGEESDGEDSSSVSDAEASSQNKSKLKSNKAKKHKGKPLPSKSTKKCDGTPEKLSSAQKRRSASEEESSARKSRRISTGKRPLYNTKRKLLLDSDSATEDYSDSDGSCSRNKSNKSPDSSTLSEVSRSYITKPKRRIWTNEEEELLFKGVVKYGLGHWAEIKQYTRLKRSNVNIKDKWRNIVSKGKEKQISKRLGIKLNS